MTVGKPNLNNKANLLVWFCLDARPSPPLQSLYRVIRSGSIHSVNCGPYKKARTLKHGANFPILKYRWESSLCLRDGIVHIGLPRSDTMACSFFKLPYHHLSKYVAVRTETKWQQKHIILLDLFKSSNAAVNNLTKQIFWPRQKYCKPTNGTYHNHNPIPITSQSTRSRTVGICTYTQFYQF